jgi:myo-inositol-1(or 4)-monophosphatase
MSEILELLELSKSVAIQAGSRLLEECDQDHKSYVYSNEQPKEIKALADTVLEKDILKALVSSRIPILSEESGYIPGQNKTEYLFIIDPLDGTFNFVKGLGSSAVSIALWKDKTPVFGVIYNLSEEKLYWGGNGLSAYCDSQQISVSNVSNKSQASICTGIPVRFDVESDISMQKLWHLIKPFAKVRMLGSAAVSLLKVAQGSADAYAEQNIMIWDVAAGIAIVEGAGGNVHSHSGKIEHSLSVYASNHLLFGQA